MSLKPDESALINMRNTAIQSEGFSIYKLSFYHGFTVVTLTAPWYCGRNVGISIKCYYIINVDMYYVLKE